MRKLHLLLLIVVFIALGFSSQGNIDRYIREETGDLEKLIRKAKWVEGTVYFDNDSLSTLLLQYRRRDDINFYLFCVAKIHEDSIRVFTAKDIYGYKMDGDYYQCYCTGNMHYFIHQVHNGKIALYERKYIPGDMQFLYYMKIPGNDYFFVVNPLEKNITEHRLPKAVRPSSESATKTYFVSNRIHEKFKLFVIRYLGDCNTVCNKVTSGSYTIYDLPSIVETYNQCGE
ncbi:MAG: hypothetical protein ACOC10_05490 [Bacteroidota bacterium]